MTSEELHAPNDGGYGSVHETLVHAMDAEWSWARVIWTGEGIDADWDAFDLRTADFLDVAAIRVKWTEVAAFLHDFVEALTPEGENSPNQIIVWEGDGGALRRRPLWQLMLHVANHGTQHRSEIAMALTRFGHSPGELDISQYARLNVPEPSE